MASREHVVEDLFGFAELTGETTVPSIDKKPDDSQKFHFEKEKIKRDINEVVVPMFFEKSGLKKYKVLARHQVEDDEDIKRPDSSERRSPNSEEQRKENICVDRRIDKSQKCKTETLGQVKKTKVKKIEKRKENVVKDIKPSLSKSTLKCELSKEHKDKYDRKKNKNENKKDEKVESSVSKVPKAVNAKFNGDSDSNSELKIKSVGENKVNEICSNSLIGECEDVSKNTFVENQMVQDPLKIKCHVKLRRDPSIENFYKVKPDNDISNINPEVTDRSLKSGVESDIKNECFHRSSPAEMKALCRQSSSEDISANTADMVYNVDIQVRKSGRLQSAKCASRYRGDYGIRVDTYKQLISKTASSSNNCSETNEQETIGIEKGDPVIEISSETQVVNKDLPSGKTLKVEKISVKENVSIKESRDEAYLVNDIEVNENKQEIAESLVEKLRIDTENHNNSSEEFTVIKKADNFLAMERNGHMHTEHITESFNEIFCNKEYEIGEKECRLDLESDRNLLSEVKNLTSELVNKTCEIVSGGQVGNQINDLKIYSSKESTDTCRCIEGDGNNINIAQYDRKVIKECSEVASEVPCSNILEGSKSCTCDIRLDNFSKCVNHMEICKDKLKYRLENELITSQKTEVGNNYLNMPKNTIGDDHECLESIQNISKCSDRGNSHYVHSVGKSVNKIQNRIRGRKPVTDLNSILTENDNSPECSPVKDPAKILECLRQRLFENAGANLVEADKAPKQFESKLISSKQRQSTMEGNFTETINDYQVRDSDSASTKSGKSTPRCTTPRQEVSKEILEEVAKSLNVLHQAKRRSENVNMCKIATKKQRFEDKKFMLRSMITSDNADPSETTNLKTKLLVEELAGNEKPVFVGRIAERTRSSRSSCESNVGSSDMSKLKGENIGQTNDMNIKKKNIEQNKNNLKLKPVKCSACGHLFKTKDLLRKHFPCRIRQTRTWSQNKLRPNRAVKRNENGSKRFVCKLPKASKPEPNKSRPQLLTYRKTKFRRVKGKRRRKLYQLIQDLIQKRNPAKWHHLSILYDDLSFKEQCLYKLGLICIGNAAEGLERYTAEDITLFEQHRAKERWLTEDAQTFVHSIPDTSKPLTDLNVSTDLSTDTQESDFFSPKHVINFPQENFQNTICDNVMIQDENDGARKQSVVNIVENGLEEEAVISHSEPSSKNDPCTAPNYLLHPRIEEQEAEISFEETEEIRAPEILNADICFQECPEGFNISIPLMDMKNDTVCENTDNTLKESQLETFTSIAESNGCEEAVQELPPYTAEVITDFTVENPFKIAVAFDIVTKDTYMKSGNETHVHELLDKSLENSTICQKKAMEETSESASSCTDLSTDLPSKDHVDNGGKKHYPEKVSSEEISSPFTVSLVCQVKTKEDIEYQVQTPEERVSRLEDTVSREHMSETKAIHVNIKKSDEKFLPLSVSEAKNNEGVKKVPLRNECFAVPDIELFHQTAKLDDKFLAVPLLTEQREEVSDIEMTKSSCTSSRKNGPIKSDLSVETGGLLNEMIGSVEQRTKDDDKFAPEHEKTDKMVYLKASNISPFKGILKNVCTKKEFTSVSTSQKDSGLSKEDPIEKSPKKKIDFKTYARRKGLIKEKNEEKNKESMQADFHNDEFKVNDKREDSDVNEKEHLRSESSTEIEDGLLGRLLDAVNLIDSIIEEHKEETDLEENADTFSAITPEMAFEALIANKETENDDLEKLANKPYDIESEYPYTEVDEKDFTEISSVNDHDLNEFTIIDKKTGYPYSQLNNSQAFENVKEEVLPAIIEDLYLDKINVISPQNEKSLTNHMMSDIVYNVDDYKEDTNETRKEFGNDAQAKENTDDFENVEVLQSEIKINECNIIDNKTVNSVEILDTCQDNLIENKDETKDATEISVKRTEIEITQNNPNQFVVQNVTLSNQPCLENKKLKIKQDDVVEKTYLKETNSEDNDEADKCYLNEIVKSPDHIAKKGLKKAAESTSIKESKKDFTIKYEMNGIVVKENLLTGDKNVVENSSPFRSSAESESNCDQSSLSELDVSSNVENDISFDGNVSRAKDSEVKDIVTSSEKIEVDLLANKASEEKSESFNVVCQISSTEKSSYEGKFNEQTNQMERPCANLPLDKLLEVNVPIQNDIPPCIKDHSVTEEKIKCVVDLPVSNVPDIQHHLIDHFVQDESTENVTDKPLEDKKEKMKFIKILDDRFVGSPPVLEKVEVSEENIDEQDMDTSSPRTEISVEGEPPLLEPQHFEKNQFEEIIPAESQHSKRQNKHNFEVDCKVMKNDKLVKQERHFLDILSVVGSEAKDTNVFAPFNNEFGENEIEHSKKTPNEEFYKDDSTFNEDIGRHFSDVMSEPVETPKSPKSKLQFLFDNNECGDISLDQIKDVLSPFSVKGKKKSISKESLLKIKTSISDLLVRIEKQTQKDSKLLKHEFQSSKTEKINAENKYGHKDGESSGEVDALGDDSKKKQLDNQTSKSFIAEHILQMLNSLEDKGNIAENMSSLLGILAENLGFLGKGKVEDLSSDSDYSCSEDTNLISSTENTQKELIAEYLEEGEQPPSIDDIPTANNLDVSDVNDSLKINEENSGLIKDSYSYESGNDIKGNTNEDIFSQMEPKKENQAIDSDTHLKEANMEKMLKDDLNFGDSEDSLLLKCDHAKNEKHKATTIFKSITELNSIETDEESVTDEPFDPVSMTARLSDLKVIAKDNNRWEFNSDYNSDDDKLDYYDSDYENDFETHPFYFAEETSKDKVRRNIISETESVNKLHTDSFGNQDICSEKDGEILGKDKIKSDILSNKIAISDVSVKINGKLLDIDKTLEGIGNLTQDSEKNTEHITENHDFEPDSKVSENYENATTNTLDYEKQTTTKTRSVEPNLPKYKVDNIFTSFANDIEKATVVTSDPVQEKHVKRISNELNDIDDIENQSIKAEIDPLSDQEKDLSDDYDWENDIFKDDCLTVTRTDTAVERLDTNLDNKKKNLLYDRNALESSGEGDLKLRLEVDPSNEDPISRKEENGSIDFQTIDISSDENDSYHNETTFNDELSCKDDEDTTETVKYEESLNTDRNFSDVAFEIIKENEQKDKLKEKENPKILCTSRQDSISGLSNVGLFQNYETEANGASNENLSSLIKGNVSDEYSDFGKTDAQFNLKNIEVISDDNDQTNKRRSTSLNTDDDYSDNFCESIAEKVKRKQRERSKSVCYNFNPWLYYSAAYVREVTKPARKEFSVFRSSILEKRAREKSFSPDKDFYSTTRKKRSSSIHKETKCSSILKNDSTNDERIHAEQQDFQIKPCSVLIPKLKEDVILKYTSRKRKCEEGTTENRPPIKVTIKLSQILYPPPNSPYGSTSASSDTYRSGYESCSEESESDSVCDTRHKKEMTSNLRPVENSQEVNLDKDETKTAEVISSEPLKIKIRTFRTKNDEENQRTYNSDNNDHQLENLDSLNDSSSKNNIETSPNGLAEELTESEVLLDIERECEKMKSSRSTDKIQFYLSESDSDNEQQKSVAQEFDKRYSENQTTFEQGVLSKSSFQAECGESDVDLSDSDTDSEIQDAIDRILNSKSSSDIIGEMVEDPVINKEPSLKKEKGSIIRMIVSDLRLSESESDTENEESEVYTTGKENDITQDYVHQEEFHNLKENYNCSQHETLPQQNVPERNIILSGNNKCMGTQLAEDIKAQFQESSSVNGIVKCLELDIVQEEESKSCYCSGTNSPSGVKASSVLDPVNERISKEPIEQVVAQSPILDDSDQNHVKECNFKEKAAIRANTVDSLEPLDLSVISMINVQVSLESPYDQLSTESPFEDVEEKTNNLGTLDVIRSNSTSTDTNLYSDNQYSRKRLLTSEEASDEIGNCNSIGENNNKKAKLSDLRIDLHGNNQINTAKSDLHHDNTNDELVFSNNRKNISECHQQNNKEIEKVSIDNKNNCDNDEIDMDRDRMNVDTSLQEYASSDKDKNSYTDFDVAEHSKAFAKCEMSEEDSKQLENVSAVKNLEEDIFQDVQTVHNATEDEMIYYAVELSDDLETSEAVVNLETVEMIEGPLIIEDSESIEENVIDTNIIESHINDQFEISSEALNEQVVEILNEPKLPDESRINCALENMPQMENVSINNIKSKYLYGINEDSQSSTEVVEELVTEIVNDNAVIEISHQSVENQTQFTSEQTPWENLNDSNQFLEVNQQVSEKSQLVTGIRNEATVDEQNNLENEEKFSDCADDQLSRNVIQNANVVNGKSCNVKSVEHVSKLFQQNLDRSLKNESHATVENTMIIDKEVMKTEYNVGDSSLYSHFEDNYTCPLNISDHRLNTSNLCSGQDSFVQVKFDNLSHGNDLLKSDSCANDYSDIDPCIEPNRRKEDMYSGVSEDINTVQGHSNYEDNAMIVERNEDNDYIITKNVNDDDDDDEMEFE